MTCPKEAHSFSFKDAKICMTTVADPCPIMNFNGMLGLWLVPLFLAFLVAACSAVSLNLYCCHICVDDIIK